MPFQRARAILVATMTFLPAACGEGVPPSVPTTIEVRMITDETGNYFDPAEITAHPGDVLRFALVSGVHNFHIPAETNPGVADLPGPGPLLQLPGQTWDWTVDIPSGEYAFQCDPHAALGMVGTLTVTN